MSSGKSVLFPSYLKSVAIAQSGPAPIGGDTLKEELKKSYSQGYQDASNVFNAQILEMRRQMQEHAHGVLSKIENSYGDMASAIVAELPELIVASVHKIVSEAVMDPAVLRGRVNELLEKSCPQNEPVEVVLNKEDLERLQKLDESYVSRHPRLTFKVDETLQPGDCLLRTKFGEVDAKLKTQLQRLFEELQGV